MRRKKVPVLIRLVKRIDRVYGDLPENAPELGICWPWLGARTTKGHGVIRDDAGNLAYTHRIAFTAALAEAGISGDYALARSRELFPRGERTPLNDEQRAALFADLTAPANAL